MSTLKGTTTDTLTKLFDWETIYNEGTPSIRITNTDAANSLDYEVHTTMFENGEDNIYESGTITFGNFVVVSFNRNMKNISVWLKSTTAGSAATFTIENYTTDGAEDNFLQVFKDPLIKFARIHNVPTWMMIASMNTSKSFPGAFGSSSNDGTICAASVETYDGTAWIVEPNMNTPRGSLSAFGSSSTDGTVAGGVGNISSATTETETYNGTTWTTKANMNTARYYLTAFGSSANDGVAVGGYNSTDYFLSSAEKYNGTTWTTTGGIWTNTELASSFGSSSNDGVIAGGDDGTNTLATMEKYNGTSWGSYTNMNIARSSLSAFGSSSSDGNTAGGRQSLNQIYGGVDTESYNGATWTVGPNLNNARADFGAFGSSTKDGTVAGSNVTAETYKTPDPSRSYPYYWKEELS